MAEHAAIGVKPAEFWRLTPRESYALFSGAEKIRISARQLALWSAWHGALFERSKKLPELKPMLDKMNPAEPMTPSQLRASLIAIAKQMGAKIVQH